MNSICAPGGLEIFDGTIVTLKRFPNTKWIVRNGCYFYGGKQYNGWYFSSIPSQTIVPMNRQDLACLTIISGFIPPPSPCKPSGNGCDGGCICSCGQPDCDCDYECGNDGPDCPSDNTPKPPRPPKPTPTPPAPPTPPSEVAIRSPELYARGVSYLKGQLVYLVPGQLYQVTQNFRSSRRNSSAQANFDLDAEAGYIVPVSNEGLLAAIVDELNASVQTTKETLDQLGVKVESNMIHKFLVRFRDAFGTNTPNKEQADQFLANLPTPITPSVGVFFKNLDTLTPTAGHVFTYYPSQFNPNILLFINDSVNGIHRNVGTLVQDVTLIENSDGTYSVSKTMINPVTGEVNTTIEQLPFVTTSILANYYTSEQITETLTTIRSDLESQIQEVDDKVVNVGNQIDQVESRIDTVESSVDDIKDEIGIGSSGPGTGGSLAGRITDLESKMVTVEGNISSHDSSISDLETEFIDIATRISSSEVTIVNQGILITSLEGTVSDLSTRTSAAEAAIEALQQEVGSTSGGDSLGDRVEALEGKVVLQDTAIGDAIDRIESVEGSVSSIGTLVDGMGVTLSDLGTTVSSIDSDLSDLGTTVDGINEELQQHTAGSAAGTDGMHSNNNFTDDDVSKVGALNVPGTGTGTKVLDDNGEYVTIQISIPEI